MISAVSSRGADVIGGLALQRSRIAAQAEEFAIRLTDNVATK